MSVASEGAGPAAKHLPPATVDHLYRKITLRFVPLLFICYVFNYMDRTNIGFAQLQMKGDLEISDISYGIGAGILFVSYALFAIPSSVLMAKIGARKLICGCLLGWGLTSAGTMFVRTPMQFYIVRFLLGLMEAGFFPAIIFYFSEWYPSHRRGGVIGIFISATVVAGIVSGILSGAVMTYMNGLWRIRGWQWLFLVEGLPSALLAIVIYFYLDDRPAAAKWLSEGEQKALRDAIADDPAISTTHTTLSSALLNWRIYLIGLIYFLAVLNAFILAFWQPSIIRSFGVASVMAIGIYSTIPLIAAVIAKVYVGRHSDLKREFRWHFAVPAILGAIGFVLTGIFPHNPILGIACLTLATAGVHGCMPMVWAVPGLYLSGAAVASGVALITTLGTISGAIGPVIIGALKTHSGGFAEGMYASGITLLISAVLMLAFIRDKNAPTALRDPI